MSPGTSWISATRVGMQPVSGDGKFACSHAHGTNKIGIASNHDIQQCVELPQVSNSPLGLLLFTQCSILAFLVIFGAMATT